ncbi:MAG: hypothetical protein ABEH61_00935 [Haloarculaceae archaeon]
MNARRGQLVLLAAAALALALVPLTVAYLQLGYAGDVGAAGLEDSPVRNGERLLDRGLHGAVEGVPEDYPWSNRSAAVTAVKQRLRSDIATLERVAVEDGTVYNVTYNDSRAAAWESDNCTSGPDRQFGGCAVLDGVVVQERAGETHVLAAAFDIEITTADGRWRATTVVRVGR